MLSAVDCGCYFLYFRLFEIMDGESLDSGSDNRPHGCGDPDVDILSELERSHVESRAGSHG